MALSTYADLLSALAAFSIRSDQAALWPDCVTLAEAQMNQAFAGAIGAGRQIRPMQARTTLVVDAEFVAAPDDLIKPIAFDLATDPVTPLTYLTPKVLVRLRQDAEAYLAALQAPAWYALIGSEFQIFPPPETPYTGELTYFQKLPPLATAGTNWLLERHPNAYLYGALAQYGAMAADQRLSTWVTAYQAAMDGVAQAYPNEPDGARLRTELPALTNRYCRGTADG